MRPTFTAAQRARVYEKSGGRCHHCKMELLQSAFDVDHFPVRYADIEDQMFVPCCGSVTDPRDFDNLVASCKSCNRSHRFESTQWCGHSQLRVRRSIVRLAVATVLSAGLGFLVGTLVS